MKIPILARRIALLTLLVIMASSGLVTITAQSARALASCPVTMYDGTTIDTKTYFEGKCADVNKDFPNRSPQCDGSWGFVVPRGSDCKDALDGVNSKDDFYNKMYWIYNTRGWKDHDWWAKDGAAFVVMTLIGKTNPPSDRNLTNADWAEFKSRLDNPALTISFDNNYIVSANNSSSIYPKDAANGNPDFAYVHYDHVERGSAYIFKLNGNFVGAIERKCANLLGEFPLPDVSPWTTAGESKVGVDHDPNVQTWNETYPGQTVTWNHRLWNNSSYDMDRNIYWSVRQSGFVNPISQWRNSWTNPDGWGQAKAGKDIVNTGPSAPPDYNTYYVVRDEEVGQTLCQWLVWTPQAWDIAIDTQPTGKSEKACVYIPYTFDLKPSVAPITPAAESGVTIGPIVPTVGNGGKTWSYKDTQWQVSRFVLDPGEAIPGGTDKQQQPCAYYGNGCQRVNSGSQQFERTDTVVGQIPTYDVQDLKLGSQVCFALSVTGYNQDHVPTDGWWRHSQPQCVKIGKKPKVQVWGDDLAVRGSITASTTLKGSSAFGSWVEYGALSVGANNQFASGAGLVSQSSTDQASWSKLTFANVAPNYGKYTTDNFRPLPNIAGFFKALVGPTTPAYSAGGSLDSNSFRTGDPVSVRTVNGDLDLSAQSLSASNSVVIIASGTVTIKGDITYSGDGLRETRNIPQLVIIAKDINVEQAASTVDAWLIADGTVNTCSDIPNAGNPAAVKLSGSICSNILTIHGPVVSSKLILNRTGGSGVGPESGKAAEVFDLRPDAYLWGQLVASGSGKAQTVDTIELPPRF